MTPRERARIEYELAHADEIVARVLDKREHVIVPMSTLRKFASLWRSARAGIPCALCAGHDFHLLTCPNFQGDYNQNREAASP